MSRKQPDIPKLPGFVDTHFHALQMSERDTDVAGTIGTAIQAGMILAVEVGVHPDELATRLRLLPARPEILRSSGIGPSNSGTASEQDFSTLATQIASNGLCAIGEIGLDWFRNYAPRADQTTVFRRQLEMARAADLPVLVHNRNADDDVIEALRSAALSRGGIMHCFSSDWPTAKKALDVGFLISFSGNVTFRNADNLREVARKVPEDRLLVETDSPYLAPDPLRGSPNTPLLCPLIYERIAQIRNANISDLVEHIGQNTRSLFQHIG